MNIPKKVTIVSSDDGDWEGIYFDGELVAEGHSIRHIDLMDALELDYEWRTPDPKWMYRMGRLPSMLSDVKEEE